MLWFVPHGPLHHVPLHAVNVAGQPLVERNPICYTPSAAVMRHCQNRCTGRRSGALVLGDSRDDLIHAREEAAMIAARFDRPAVCGADATKQRLPEVLRDPERRTDVLHFACHGYFDPEDPRASGIVLADAGAREPNLTADEILELELTADLVAVSACESGVSEQRAGDELIGLARALVIAGAPSVLVTLWPVDDLSITLVMDEFYRRLLEGTVSKAESLRAAQRAVRTLTAGDLVAHCQARLQAVTADDPNRLVLLADRARARAAAGDIDAAVSGYRELETEAAAAPVDGGAELARSARNAIEMLSLRSELPWEADYSVCPFADPYHWAAVELVGDWR